MPTASDHLLTAIASPAFPNAACVGQHRVFDAAKEDPEPALRLCARCAAISRCAEWAAQQDWPAGTVVAGRVMAEKPKRPRPTRLPQKTPYVARRPTNAAKADALVAEWREQLKKRRAAG